MAHLLRSLSCILKVIALQSSFHQIFIVAFAPFYRSTRVHIDNELFVIPTNVQLSSDPFIQQVAHASTIVEMLSEKDCDRVFELLLAQLSHSDGIRGFFATYLTGEAITLADANTVPSTLAKALKSIPDHLALISISCKNVIMPTAMSSMHKDSSLRNSSLITAIRGTTVLNYLKVIYPDDTKRTCQDILVAIENENISSDVNVNYWRTFFKTYGYQEKQLQDIAATLMSLDVV